MAQKSLSDQQIQEALVSWAKNGYIEYYKVPVNGDGLTKLLTVSFISAFLGFIWGFVLARCSF